MTVLDPREGLTSDGMIRTGVDRARVPAAFEPLLDDVIREFTDLQIPKAELHLYGSVATGTARIGESDVDLVLVNGPDSWAREVGADLSRRYADLCRGVEIGVAKDSDYTGRGDEAYGNRVFLRHYCVPLAGANAIRQDAPFPGDARAARGFNGDIAARLARWRVGEATARGVARKSLLAAAGVVSVRTGKWTTYRATAARRWADLDPARRGDLERLLLWANDSPASADQLAEALDGIVADIVDQFAVEVGLWEELSLPLTTEQGAQTPRPGGPATA